MKPTDADRDLAFDRLLAGGLSRQADATGRACPDADLLAAWFDRSLSAPEAERIEAHAAHCAICQQILADLARSEPPVVRAAPEPAPAKPWHWHWRWAVPLATVAVVVVFATRPLRAPSEMPSSQRTAVQRSAENRPVEPPVPQLPGTAAAQPGAAPSTDEPRSTAGVPSPAVQAPPPGAAKETETARRERADAEPRVPAPAAPAPVPTPAAATNVAPQRLGITPVGQLAERAQPSNQTAFGGGAPREAQKSTAAADAVGGVHEGLAVAAPGNPPSAAPSVLVRPAGAKPELRVAPLPVAFSAAGKVGWRVGEAGNIERTSDGGKSWQRQDTGLAVNLTAASAASDSACWVVGSGGLVARTVDGSTWLRTASPTTASLVAVRAASPDVATVRAADGSEFTTSDGGKTWTRVNRK